MLHLIYTSHKCQFGIGSCIIGLEAKLQAAEGGDASHASGFAKMVKSITTKWNANIFLEKDGTLLAQSYVL